MAKRTTPKPEASAPDQGAAAAQGQTMTANEDAAATDSAASVPTPAPAQGNEGQAEAAGEGQPSSASTGNPDRLFGGQNTLIVTGPRAGRRRAGRQFGSLGVTLLVSDLTEAEIAALLGDPALTVQLVDAPY